jgi:protein-L-isoaspartate(D-aspartate) O-methyltransferase
MEKDITIGLRRQMVENLALELKSRKFESFEKILEILNVIPRHEYAPNGFEKLAYAIQPLLIDEDQTMSSPLTVAIQTLLLHIQPTDKILEIGTGSGYQASVLSMLCEHVYTMERHEILYNKAKLYFRKNNFKNIDCFWKDGFEGLENIAPFDKIIVTCGAEKMPDTLLRQLKIGGKILLPINSKDSNGYLLRSIKISDTEYYDEQFQGFSFVPMLEGINPV